jgi:hypothetical protein
VRINFIITASESKINVFEDIISTWEFCNLFSLFVSLAALFILFAALDFGSGFGILEKSRGGWQSLRRNFALSQGIGHDPIQSKSLAM